MKMVIGLLADSHGNYLNLSEGYKVLEPFDPERVFILGDAIHNGNTPQENAILRFIMNSDAKLIKGNHEEEVLSSSDPLVALDCDVSLWLPSVPTQIYLQAEGILLVHSLSEGLERVLDEEKVGLAVDKLRSGPHGEPNLRRVFFSHTHVPAIYNMDGKNPQRINPVMGEEIPLDGDSIYAIGLGALTPYPGGKGETDPDLPRTVSVYDEVKDAVSFVLMDT